MRNLSKSKIIAYRQCPKRLWLEIYKAELRDDSASERVFQIGNQVGEVARILSRTHGEQSSKPGEPLGQLDDELADIMFVVMCLANQSGINLQAALERNLAKKTKRDIHRHRDNAKLRIQ